MSNILVLTEQEFKEVLGKGICSKKDFRQNGNVIIENIQVTSTVNLYDEEQYPLNIDIKNGEFSGGFHIHGGNFTGVFLISSGNFQREFRIDSGTFSKVFRINGGTFQANFSLNGGNFLKDFLISEGEFKSGCKFNNSEHKGIFRIDGGTFNGEFLIKGVVFSGGFFIHNGLFESDFNVSGESFKEIFSIIGGKYNGNFLISSGKFGSNFLIKGGDFNKTFQIIKGDFAGEFLINGGTFSGEFLINGGTFGGGFTINEVDFYDNFRIAKGDFKGPFKIHGYSKGIFQKLFWISGGDFSSDFFINGATFLKLFMIVGGNFKAELKINKGSFDEFSLLGSTSINKLSISSTLGSISINKLKLDLSLKEFTIKEREDIRQNETVKINELKLYRAPGTVSLVNVSTIQDIQFIDHDSTSNTTIAFLNCKLNNLTLINFNNFGKITVNSLSPLLNTLNRDSLGPNDARPTIKVKNSDLGIFNFISSSLEEYDFVVDNSKLINLFYTNTKFPTEISTEKYNKKERYQQLRDTYDQLQTVAAKQGDKVAALDFQAKSLEYYRTYLSWKTRKWWLLSLMRISNNYRQSSLFAFVFIIFTGLLCFSFYTLAVTHSLELGFPNSQTVRDWSSSFLNYLGYFPEFLNITHKTDYIQTPVSKSWAYAFDFIGKIVVGFGIVQLVQAFRRFGKGGD
jgi:hypothetical protein